MLAAFLTSQANAATYYEEQSQLVRAGRSVAALGPDLFGDKVNLYNGSLQFVQTDVALPGNSALPVAVARRFHGSGPLQKVNGHFGRWDLEIPRIHGVFAASTGFVNDWGATDRCSRFTAPPTVSGMWRDGFWVAREYWRGNMLYVPGVGDQEILNRASEYPGGPSNGHNYPLVTRERWMIRCIPLAQGAGEGFLALAPDGTEYRFDWMVLRPAVVLARGARTPEPMGTIDNEGTRTPSPDPTRPQDYLLNRNEYWILPTQVKDRFGNTVRYEYSASVPAQLLRIVSSDERRLDIRYENASSNRISSVSDGTRSWTYSYDSAGDLSGVVLPDQSRWIYSGAEFFLSSYGIYRGAPGCVGSGLVNPISATMTMTHPSGAVGHFTTVGTEHARAFVERLCFGQFQIYSNSPPYYALPSLASKTLSGPGVPSANWQYSYSPPDGAGSYSDCSGNCPETKWTLVVEPSGAQVKHTYGIRADKNEGLLLQTDHKDAAGQTLRSVSMRYRAWNAGPYPSQMGSSVIKFGNDAPSTRLHPLESRLISQQGSNFSWTANSFDELGRPLSVSKAGPGGSREETTRYADNTALWVFGQIDTVISGGLTVVDNDYFTSTASLRSSSKFGAFQHSFTYHDDGSLASRTDGRNHSTYFDNYKRGLPQRVRYPDGTSESAVVNDIGLVSSVSSAAGYTTDYGYDSSGRLNRITPPSGWTPSTLEFEQVWSPEYGLPAGHWRQTISKGNARTISYFDAFWRPVMTRSFDASSSASEASTRKVVVKGFDAEGHVTFESYPQRELGSVAISSPGRRSRYDALGRLVQQDADSELGVLSSSTEYIGGFQVRHSNPRGKQSTQTLWALDKPDEAQLSAISVPAGDGLPGGMNVSIQRDAFGKPSSITRSGGVGGNSVSVTRSYVYDAKQRLCKTVEPETGATIQDYDTAGNIAWRAPGVAFTVLGSCDQDRVPASARIRHEHDEVNQLTFTEFGDGSPAITRSYWPDGKLKTVGTSKGDSWSYVYNGLRLLETETLSHAGQSYGISWGYDGNGSLSSLSYPGGGPVITYLPNALGEPSRVGSYAAGVGFHPNGAVAAYTLGNGIAHRMTQNARGLPELNEDSGVMKDVYSYDRNGNVTGIADQQEGVFHRTMSYDDLDRLWTANAPGVWGQASYGYDAVDNLRSAVVGSRSSTLMYDASNKLSRMVTNGSPADYLYDPRGNLTNKGAQAFRFDLGNRLAWASLGGEYAYDGLGRRIQVQAPDGKKRIQVYSHAGQLLWGEAISTGTVPALRTDTCNMGRPVNGQCVTESQYPATERYSCDTGDGEPQGPEHTCTHVSTSNYPAIAKGHRCETGDGLPQGPTFICTHTSSTPYGATPTGYQCKAGDGQPQGPNHSCTSNVPTPYPAIVTGRICRAGDGEPQGPSHICTAITVLGQANAVYACPTGYVLGGQTCSLTVPSTPARSIGCNGAGNLSAYPGGVDGQACQDNAVEAQNSGEAAEACAATYEHHGLQLLAVRRKAGKIWTCIFAPAVTYTCPAGAVLNTSTNQCITTYNQPASFDHYHCSSGSVSGSNCITSSDYYAFAVYSCHAGDPPPVGDTCSQAAGTPYPATPTGYACNAGDPPPVGTQCTSTSSSTYFAQPTHWECNTGDPAPVGGFCTQTTTRYYRATYRGSACNAGDGAPNAGGMCTLLTVMGNATPVYSCANGSTPVQGMCPGATTRVGTAYIYLGGKQIAEVVVGGATQYVHTDALGSPVAHTGPSPNGGPPLNRTRYEPYGFTAAGTKPGPATSSIGFTGHVNDPETDLVYMQQRYYDPIAGRFLSVDPVETDVNTGAGFGLYTYVNNNPYGSIDPDGRFSNDDCRAMAGNCEILVDNGSDNKSSWRSTAGADGNYVSTVLENSFDSVVSDGAMLAFPPLIVARLALGTWRTVGDYLHTPTIEGTAIFALSLAIRIGPAARGPMWTSTKSQSIAANAYRHFKDHGADFGAINAVDYVRKAREFLHNPGAGVLSKTRGNGDVVRFDPATNAFGVMDKTGAPRTFYIPDPAKHGYRTNLDYFNAQ